MRRVLLIAFHYPPDNSSTGVLRTLKFTQYLDEFGWHPHVLTVDPAVYPFRDSELGARVPPGIEVTRVWCPDIRSAIGLRGRYPGWLAVPDRFIGWVVSGYKPAREVLRLQSFDLLYSTQPVPTAHLLGWRLKRATGLPWMADFRDPWVEGTLTGLRGQVERWLERRVVHAADRVICNTPRMREAFLSRYPETPAQRFAVITNGYDEPDFVDLPVPPSGGPFTIVYPGVVDGGNRNPVPLIEAVGRAIRSGRIPLADVSLRFVGGGPLLFSETVQRAIQASGLERVTVRIRDRIPYRESLGQLAQADVLVVLSEPSGTGPGVQAELAYSQMMVPAKVYEYLRLGRPILALVGDGAVRDLLGTLAVGCTAAPSRLDEAAAFLARCYAERHRLRGRPAEPPPALAAYDRRALTARLAERFDELVWTSEVVGARG